MVRRYAHLASDRLAAYAGKVEFTTGTNPSRIEGKFMVARGGIEPPTRGFSVRCSTN
jgi:hypothetical protein